MLEYKYKLDSNINTVSAHNLNWFIPYTARSLASNPMIGKFLIADRLCYTIFITLFEKNIFLFQTTRFRDSTFAMNITMKSLRKKIICKRNLLNLIWPQISVSLRDRYQDVYLTQQRCPISF